MGDPPSRLARWAWAAASAATLALAFPFRAGDLYLDVAAPAGFAVPICFVAMLRGLRPRAAFLWGTAAATAGYCIVLYWIWVVVRVHGHAPAPVAALAVLALALYVGLHVGAASGIAARLAPSAGAAGLLLLPSAWVVGEHLRGFDLFSGFPWGFLGYSLVDLAAARGIAGVAGVYGLSFALVLLGTLVFASGRMRRYGLILWAVLLAGGGLREAAFAPEGSGRALRVGVVQANIPQEQKWDPEHAREAFEAHLALSREAATGGPVELVVWPEASAPVFLQVEEIYRRAVSELAREQEVALIVGGLAFERTGSRDDVSFHNSVFAVDPSGRFVERYDKSRLVPFGEYVPLRPLLGFLSGLATGIASGDITPGPGPRALALDSLGSRHALAPLICYEVIYPDLVREAVGAGARVLVNVTNDAWYGRTSAPHQFLEIAAMRAAEHGLPMVRAANTGISAVVDATGAVRAATPIFERRMLREVVPPGGKRRTPYARLGDWIVWASWGILAYAGGRGLVGRGGRRDPRDGRAAPRSAEAGGGAPEASLTSTPSAGASRS